MFRHNAADKILSRHNLFSYLSGFFITCLTLQLVSINVDLFVFQIQSQKTQKLMEMHIA